MSQMDSDESSKTKKWMEMVRIMAGELECPVCMTCVVPPIKTCLSGHGICESCSAKVQNCPLCQQQWSPNQKNTLLDKLVASLLLPCAFHDEGCTQILSVKSKIQHEIECGFRTFDCPLVPSVDCNWRGNQNEVATHLLKSHSECSLVFKYEEKIPYSLLDDDDDDDSDNENEDKDKDKDKDEEKGKEKKDTKRKWIRNSLNTFHFLIIDNAVLTLHELPKEPSAVYFALQILGNTEFASKFKYRLTLSSEEGFSLIFEGIPIPHYVKVEGDFLKSNKCISIPLELYKKYVPDEEKTKFQLQIIKKKFTSIKKLK